MLVCKFVWFFLFNIWEGGVFFILILFCFLLLYATSLYFINVVSSLYFLFSSLHLLFLQVYSTQLRQHLNRHKTDKIRSLTITRPPRERNKFSALSPPYCTAEVRIDLFHFSFFTWYDCVDFRFGILHFIASEKYIDQAEWKVKQQEKFSS